MATATKLITAEEFALLPNPEDGSKQELVRGERHGPALMIAIVAVREGHRAVVLADDGLVGAADDQALRAKLVVQHVGHGLEPQVVQERPVLIPADDVGIEASRLTGIVRYYRSQ